MCETSQRHTGASSSQRRQSTNQATLEAGADAGADDAWKNLTPPPAPPQKKITAPAQPRFNPPPPKVTPPAAVSKAPPVQPAAKPAAAAPTPPPIRPAAPATPAPVSSFESQLKALRTNPDKTEKLTKILDLALSHEEQVAHAESKEAKKARTSLVLSELHLALRGAAVAPMMLEGNMKGMLIEGIRGELATILGSKRAKERYPIFLRG